MKNMFYKEYPITDPNHFKRIYPHLNKRAKLLCHNVNISFLLDPRMEEFKKYNYLLCKKQELV